MRLITIDISNLVNLRETLQLKLSIVHAFVFALIIGFWWLLIEQNQFSFYGFILRGLIAAVILIPFLLIILPRKNYLARLIYFLILVFNGLFFLLFSLAGIARILSTGSDFPAYLLLAYSLMYLLASSKHIYRLFFSLISFGRMRNLKHEISHSLRLWKKETSKFENKTAGKRVETYINQPAHGRKYRLALSLIAFFIGWIFILLTFINALMPEILFSIYNFEFLKVWRVLQNFPVVDSSDELMASETWFEILTTVLLFLPASFFFFIFGFFQNQRRREKIRVCELPLSQDINPSDILLLRSFKDDVNQVNKQINPFLFPFKLYPWAYTLEQLIVNRLKKFGKVHLLDEQKENRHLLKKWFLKHFVSLLGEERVIKFLELHCPIIWRKIPPIGGIRHYMKNPADEEWQEEISRSMPIARMQLVVIGEEPKNLDWEIRKINELNLLEKTVFLMPSPVLFGNYQKRWLYFIDYLNANTNYDGEALRKIKPDRVLAICLRQNKLICITAKAHTYLFYESAIDIAAIMTISDKSVFNRFIPAYLPSSETFVVDSA